RNSGAKPWPAPGVILGRAATPGRWCPRGRRPRGHYQPFRNGSSDGTAWACATSGGMPSWRPMAKRILFIHPWFSTFVRQDERILSTHYDLDVLHFERNPSFFHQLWHVLASRRVDLVYLWFMVPEYSAFTLWLCKRYRIPYVLVTGGT